MSDTKPLYNMTHGNLSSTIWELPFAIFFLSYLHMRDLKNILGPDLVIFEICHFMMIPGSFKYSEKDPLRKSQFSQ